ncbi:transaldolase family protein [Vagococcus lutrae]|uniref:transaldolase family protein n=1 Tax=Vagococcus lutrae TaxID=81947 RepID=UPI00288E39C8|nr:transaldolase family protein [Vagococcus lutrae]MDT2825728.1 transaldolase family protein [Vagococcus lutrae]
MYLDTANIDQIKELQSYGFLKGVTTNPTLLAREKRPRVIQLQAIVQQLKPEMTLFIQLEGLSHEALYQDFLQLEATFPKVNRCYKVALNEAGLQTIASIKQSHSETSLLATAIYSAEQMYLAALAGCQYIAPYVNRMQVAGIDPYEEIHLARTFIDQKDLTAQIMGASFKNTRQIKKSYQAGAHITTVAPDVLKQMSTQPIVEQAIAQFEKDSRSFL